jgi:hypothetical protein
MKRRSPVTIVLLVAVALTAAAIIDVSFRRGRAQKAQAPTGADQNVNDDEHEKMILALRRGGYREAARIKGHYVGTFDPYWDWFRADLESLTKHSAAVLVGTPKSSHVQLSPGGDLITTEYEVSVREVLKGAFAPGDSVKVSLPGGRVEFEDGTSAELNTPDFERMDNNRSYLLFLTMNTNGSDALILTGGPPGLFELPPGGAKVKPHARASEPVSKEARDKDVGSFLEYVRRLAEKWPAPGSCCS